MWAVENLVSYVLLVGAVRVQHSHLAARLPPKARKSLKHEVISLRSIQNDQQSKNAITCSRCHRKQCGGVGFDGLFAGPCVYLWTATNLFRCSLSSFAASRPKRSLLGCGPWLHS